MNSGIINVIDKVVGFVKDLGYALNCILLVVSQTSMVPKESLKMRQELNLYLGV